MRGEGLQSESGPALALHLRVAILVLFVLFILLGTLGGLDRKRGRLVDTDIRIAHQE